MAFLDAVCNQSGCIVRICLPPDADWVLSVACGATANSFLQTATGHKQDDHAAETNPRREAARGFCLKLQQTAAAGRVRCTAVSHSWDRGKR